MADSNFISGSSLLTTDIDLLFEKFTIKQLHEIEKNVRAEIEKKKEDVRVMVGERYRDLIEAADTIAEMKVNFATVTKHIASMEEQIESVENKNSNNSTKNNVKCNAIIEPSDEYYALATQIKLLLDIPGKIWSLIETKEILSATELFLLAKHVHNWLEKERKFGIPVTNWFPVVTRQWVTTKHLKKTLTDVCEKNLKDHDVDARILSQSFAVLLILNDSNVASVFDRFLAARLDCVAEIFDAKSTLKEQNCQMVHLIVNTLNLTRDLFVDEHEGDGGMLDKTMQNVFSGRIPNTNLSNHLLEVKNHLPRIDCRFAIDELRSKCTQWIEMVKMAVNSELARAITFIKSINGLSIIRDTVLRVINEENENEKWNSICVKLLENDLQMWEDVFEPLFLNQMKSIVDFHIGSAFTRTRNDLTRFFDDADSSKKYAIEEDISTFVWRESANDLPSKINWYSSKNQVTFSNLMLKARGFTPFCETLCTHLNEDLALLIEDVAHFQTHEKNLDENVTVFLRTSTQQQIENLLKNCEKLIDDEKLTSDRVITRILALSRFLTAVTELCPTLQICIKGLQKDKKSGFRRDSGVTTVDANWENGKKRMIDEAHKLLRKWQQMIVRNAENRLENHVKCKSVQDSLVYLPLWDTIEIQEENEDGKLVSATIRIPGQTSWTLLKILHDICLEINKAGSHFLPREIVEELQTNVIECILNVYEKEISECDDSMSQMAALQFSFDVNFVSNLMSAKDDKLLATRISKLTASIESRVDPFDLDVFSPHIRVNLKKCVQRASVILGALVNPSKTNTFLSMARISSSQNEQHNILTVNNSIAHFSLLPLANNNNQSN